MVKATPFSFEHVWSICASAQSATYAGFPTSANFGPIANEVMQGVFAQSRMIDEITSHNDRWTRFNYVTSWGGAGNQNVVVYFENSLTPILKSATFDPSQFLAANAQVFKKATDVLGDVYGVPISGVSSNTSASASLNLYSTKARKAAADSASSQTRQQMLTALKGLLDLHDALAKATTTNQATQRIWASPSDPKPLQDAVAKLAALALELENPKPN